MKYWEAQQDPKVPSGLSRQTMSQLESAEVVDLVVGVGVLVGIVVVNSQQEDSSAQLLTQELVMKQKPWPRLQVAI